MRALSLTWTVCGFLYYQNVVISAVTTTQLTANSTEPWPEEDWASLRPRNKDWAPPGAEEKYGWSEVTIEETKGFSSKQTLEDIHSQPSQYDEEDSGRHLNTSVYMPDTRFEKTDARYYSKGLPVYVSLTTISSRIGRVSYTIMALLNGTVRPNRIYLMVSEDPFLLDKGTPRDKLPKELIDLKNAFPDQFRIVFTKNIGPHRKLLPVLSKFWKEDVILITVDDDNNRAQSRRSEVVSKILRYYRRSKGDSVVALRVRRIGLCDVPPHHVMSYRKFWGGASPGREEFLLLPTGTGGVLYRPRFFHPVVFSDHLRELTKVGDDLTFRIACMAGDTRVLSGCDQRTHGRCPFLDTDIRISRDGLYEKNAMMRKWKKILAKEARASQNQSIAKDKETKASEVASNLMQVQTLVDNISKEGMGTTGITASNDNRIVDEQSQSQGEGRGVMRRRLDDKKSLYMVFNRFHANEVAWNKATEFLGRGRVFDFKRKATEWVAKEREACFEEYWKREKVAKRVGYLLETILPNGTKFARQSAGVMPPRTSSCMIYTCPAQRIRGPGKDNNESRDIPISTRREKRRRNRI